MRGRKGPRDVPPQTETTREPHDCDSARLTPRFPAALLQCESPEQSERASFGRLSLTGKRRYFCEARPRGFTPARPCFRSSELGAIPPRQAVIALARGRDQRAYRESPAPAMARPAWFPALRVSALEADRATLAPELRLVPASTLRLLSEATPTSWSHIGRLRCD